MFLAERSDKTLCFFELVLRHTWEEMMLNLIIETSVPEIGQRMSMHVASSDHMTMLTPGVY